MADSSLSEEAHSKPQSLSDIVSSFESLVKELSIMKESMLKMRYKKFMNPKFYDERMDRFPITGVPMDVQMYHFNALLQIVSMLYKGQRPLKAIEVKGRADKYRLRLSEMRRELEKIHRDLVR